jgi:hypothetical protein
MANGYRTIGKATILAYDIREGVETSTPSLLDV